MSTVTQSLGERMAEVDRALEQARGEWGGWDVSVASFFGVGDAAHVRPIVEAIGRRVEAWKTTGVSLMQNAQPDQKALDRWVARGNGLLGELKLAYEEADFSSLSRIAADTVSATASDVSKAVTDTTGFFSANWGKLALAGILLVGLTLALRVPR